ncbi:MAG: class I SAM-dependent methyltransferase [Firmicutes bacterium]|nr:class I SAM-dependent methyltransferase [Bacillota bacterium]
MVDADQYIKNLEAAHLLREPVIKEAIRQLQLTPGSCGLDVGCGIGLYTLLLAEEVGPAGKVTGLDTDPRLIEYAERLAVESGLTERLSFINGDAAELPFADNTFAWAGSMDCIGYMPHEPVPLLRELARVVKPGGTVFLLIWSSQKLLPGYPMLEARLNATPSGIAPFDQTMNPEDHFMRALGWFRQAGLMEPIARTFVRDIIPPLDLGTLKALTELLQMRWGGAGAEVAREDWMTYRRLVDPASPEIILNPLDYYAFFTYSLFCGRC